MNAQAIMAKRLAGLPLVLTVSLAAKVLGFDRGTVGAMCKAKELPYIPWRGSRIHKRIPLKALLNWIDEHTVYTAEQLKTAVDGRRTA